MKCKMILTMIVVLMLSVQVSLSQNIVFPVDPPVANQWGYNSPEILMDSDFGSGTINIPSNVPGRATATGSLLLEFYTGFGDGNTVASTYLAGTDACITETWETCGSTPTVVPFEGNPQQDYTTINWEYAANGRYSGRMTFSWNFGWTNINIAD